MHLFLQPVFNCQGTLKVAKTNAELNTLVADCAHRSSRGFAFVSSAAVPAQPEGGYRYFGSTVSVVLVELIGIEPTTPCLQSRCSPS